MKSPHSFWQNILEHVEQNQNENWTMDQEEELRDQLQICWEELTVEELKVNIVRDAKWKSPGPDKLPNF